MEKKLVGRNNQLPWVHLQAKSLARLLQENILEMTGYS
jgi:hypothetical protein